MRCIGVNINLVSLVVFRFRDAEHCQHRNYYVPYLLHRIIIKRLFVQEKRLAVPLDRPYASLDRLFVMVLIDKNVIHSRLE